MSKRNTKLQSIRLSAMRHQLKALESQMEVVQKLDAEHSDGIDLGANPEARNILFYCKKLAKRAGKIVNKSVEGAKDDVSALLVKMREDVSYLLDHAADFGKHGNDRADEHLQTMVPIEVAKAASDPAFSGGSSFVEAGLSCFRAETSQVRTFEMQVMAIVYLALEVAYFAADEVGVAPMTLPVNASK